MQIATARLLLRELGDADHAAVHRFATDPEVVRYADWGPNTPEESASFLAGARRQASARPRVNYQLAIVDCSGGGLIGTLHLRVASREHHRGELGYTLARPSWGRGYGTEAAAALLRFGFGELGLHRVTATCDPENVASARVLEKIGMQREGYLRDDRLIRGQWRDRLLYAALSPGGPR